MTKFSFTVSWIISYSNRGRTPGASNYLSKIQSNTVESWVSRWHYRHAAHGYWRAWPKCDFECPKVRNWLSWIIITGWRHSGHFI